MSAEAVARVEAILRQSGVIAGPCEIRPLTGGYANTVLRIDTSDGRILAKSFGKPMAGTLFPNLPADEAEALRRLSGFGVAPELVGFWPEHDLLAYAYVEGAPWDGDVAAVARLLLRKEAADAKGFRKVSLTPAEILREGDALFARCEDGARPPRPVPADLSPPRRWSLIHTDVGPGNLIGSGDGLRLIDWQCPAMGDACEDIYDFLSPAFQILSERTPLAAPETAAFFAALDRSDLEARYLELRPYFAWRMTAYCRLRAERHPDAAVRERYRQAAAAEIDHLAG
ncbi:phosphotransferase [Defluviimonas sp. D31]|uniref:phosphotransferase n=1 Tax=Defluviimonas sp. D31 TaxID=3083253 RepID=UPI00296F5098|nr:phosphotransferase [Defluviimonas sp. D31]MDW4549928.1 phosphotransferase [Defluviimonas sp. D31]